MQHYSMFKGLYKLEVVLVLLLGTHGTSSRHPVRAMRRLDHVAQFVFFCVSSGTSAYLGRPLRRTWAAQTKAILMDIPKLYSLGVIRWTYLVSLPISTS